MNKEETRPDSSDLKDFLESFSSIDNQYENNAKQSILEFSQLSKLPSDLTGDENLHDRLWFKLIIEGGIDLDQLYCEVLYAYGDYITMTKYLDTNEFFVRLQDIFSFNNEKHKELLNSINVETGPPSVLYLDLIEARGLRITDPNGLSDPYALISVINGNSKTPNVIYNSSIKKFTLTPIWKEKFTFQVSRSPEEYLYIELFDYDDDEENLSEKLKRVGDIKGLLGFGRFLKETLGSVVGLQNHDFMGCLKINIKNIPQNGFHHWFPLKCKNNAKKLGEIHLKMTIGLEKEKEMAINDFKNLIQIIILNEIKSLKYIELYSWKWECEDHKIIKKFALKAGLSSLEILLSELVGLTEIHKIYPMISIDFLNSKFQSILFSDSGKISGDIERKMIWESIDNLMDSFTCFFSQFYISDLPNKKSLAITIIKLIEIFKFNMKKNGQTENVSILTNRNQNDLNESEFKLLSKVGQCLIECLIKLKDSFYTELQGALHLDVISIVYEVYDKRYAKIVQSKISEFEISKNRMKLLRADSSFVNEPGVIKESNLYELYLTLKNFSSLCPDTLKSQDLEIKGSFHKWFQSSISEFLIIAWSKARNFIRKSVLKESFEQIDEISNKSSSVIDSISILFQVATFWSSIEWPDADGKFIWIIKLINDYNGCSIYYIELIYDKLREFKKGNESDLKKSADKYKISNELCMILNNIECLRDSLKLFCERLNITKTIDELAKLRSKQVADTCMKTLKNTIIDSANNINNRMVEILETIVKKMEIDIRFLLKKCEDNNNDSNSIKYDLVGYLSSNVDQMRKKYEHEQSGESKYFDIFYTLIWKKMNTILSEIIESKLEKESEYFQKLKNLVKSLLTYFNNSNTNGQNDIHAKKMNCILQTISKFSKPTDELINKYYLQRSKESKIPNSNIEMGNLRVRVLYLEDSEEIKIEILNASNLKWLNSSDESTSIDFMDPYVKLEIVPEELFPNFKYQTEWKKSTQFPLFDEIFTVPFTREEISADAFFHFVVMDKNYLKDAFLGEAYLSLIQCPSTTNDTTKIQDLPQVQLYLTKVTQNDEENPENSSLLFEILDLLETRTRDSKAQSFVKQEKSRHQIKSGSGSFKKRVIPSLPPKRGNNQNNNNNSCKKGAIISKSKKEYEIILATKCGHMWHKPCLRDYIVQFRQEANKLSNGADVVCIICDPTTVSLTMTLRVDLKSQEGTIKKADGQILHLNYVAKELKEQKEVLIKKLLSMEQQVSDTEDLFKEICVKLEDSEEFIKAKEENRKNLQAARITIERHLALIRQLEIENQRLTDTFLSMRFLQGKATLSPARSSKGFFTLVSRSSIIGGGDSILSRNGSRRATRSDSMSVKGGSVINLLGIRNEQTPSSTSKEDSDVLKLRLETQTSGNFTGICTDDKKFSGESSSSFAMGDSATNVRPHLSRYNYSNRRRQQKLRMVRKDDRGTFVYKPSSVESSLKVLDSLKRMEKVCVDAATSPRRSCVTTASNNNDKCGGEINTCTYRNISFESFKSSQIPEQSLSTSQLKNFPPSYGLNRYKKRSSISTTSIGTNVICPPFGFEGSDGYESMIENVIPPPAIFDLSEQESLYGYSTVKIKPTVSIEKPPIPVPVHISKNHDNLICPPPPTFQLDQFSKKGNYSTTTSTSKFVNPNLFQDFGKSLNTLSPSTTFNSPHVLKHHHSSNLGDFTSILTSLPPPEEMMQKQQQPLMKENNARFNKTKIFTFSLPAPKPLFSPPISNFNNNFHFFSPQSSTKVKDSVLTIRPAPISFSKISSYPAAGDQNNYDNKFKFSTTFNGNYNGGGGNLLGLSQSSSYYDSITADKRQQEHQAFNLIQQQQQPKFPFSMKRLQLPPIQLPPPPPTPPGVNSLSSIEGNLFYTTPMNPIQRLVQPTSSLFPIPSVFKFNSVPNCVGQTSEPREVRRFKKAIYKKYGIRYRSRR